MSDFVIKERALSAAGNAGKYEGTYMESVYWWGHRDCRIGNKSNIFMPSASEAYKAGYAARYEEEQKAKEGDKSE